MTLIWNMLQNIQNGLNYYGARERRFNIQYSLHVQVIPNLINLLYVRQCSLSSKIYQPSEQNVYVAFQC